MSEGKMMEKWIELWGTDLDWLNKREKTTIEFEYDPSDTKYLLPHEFLFLLWNAQDRIDLIKKTKTLDLNLNKKVIRDFDFWDGVASRKIIEKDPHIYLLSPTAFENQAPNYQIKKLLDKELSNKRIKFETPSNPQRFTSLNIRAVPSNLLDQNTPICQPSKEMNEFKNDFKGLKISLDVAKNMDEVHSK